MVTTSLKQSGRTLDHLAIIIGAARSGTTSLFTWLSQHPQVCLCRLKEVGFFSNDWVWAHGMQWYDDLFDWDGACHRIAIDDSTNCSKLALYPHAADRIAEYAPNAKIIYSMRHPVARMESHYTQELAKGWRDDGSKIPTGKYGDLLETSMYAKQLQPYRDSFPEENILLLRFEEMIREPSTTLQRVCSFLGIDSSFTFRSLNKAHSSNAGRRPGDLGYFIYRFRHHVPFWAPITARLPARYANAVRRLFQRKGVRNSTFSHARYQAVLAELQDDLRTLHNDFAFDVEPWGIMCPDRDRMGGPPEDAHARPSTAP